MDLKISHSAFINRQITAHDTFPSVYLNTETATAQPEDLYKFLGCNYPKFYKMDILCKWAWLGAELVLRKDAGFVYEGMDKNKIGVVLATSQGCLDADKKYNATLADFPSPALFVYTLPNIMLGEISIRHGFKGEQACLASAAPDYEMLYFYVADILEKRGMEACLCGWVDAVSDEPEVCLFWVTKNSGGQGFTAAGMRETYEKVNVSIFSK